MANDFGYEHVFERQLYGLGRPHDAFLALSTSGRSKNILRALRAAQELGLTTIGFSGADGEEMRSLCHHFVAVPTHETTIVQQVYMVAGHAICALVERAMMIESRASENELLVEL